MRRFRAARRGLSSEARRAKEGSAALQQAATRVAKFETEGRRTFFLGLSLLLLTFLAGRAVADTDEVQEKLVRQYEVALRWDNIESDPEWVSGKEPSYCFWYGMHLVELEPGESMSFRIPAGSAVRAYAPDESLTPGELEMAYSEGLGLFVYPPVLRGEDRYSLFMIPDRPRPLLGRIQCPDEQAVTVAVFVSRTEPLPELAPYRGGVTLPARKVSIRRSDEATSQSFWVLGPEAPSSLQLLGPARYTLECRRPYGEDERDRRQAFRINVSLDDHSHRVLELESSAETAFPVSVDGKWRLVSRLEKACLEIPEGEHLLELKASVPLYVRLLRQFDPDYLLPRLNGPRMTVSEARRQLAGTTHLAPSLDWTDEELREVLENSEACVADRERAARALARDNRAGEGGLLGYLVLQEEARKHPELPAIQHAADQFRGAHTFWQNLFAGQTDGEVEPEFMYFRTRQLARAREEGRSLVVGEQHSDAWIGQIPKATFFRLPVSETEAPTEGVLIFELPERQVPSRLRVAVELPDQGWGREFRLQLDEEPPIRLAALSLEGVPLDECRTTGADAGRALLRLRREAPFLGARRFRAAPRGAEAPRSNLEVAPQLRCDTMADLLPHPETQAGTVELVLPASTRTLRLWATTPGAEPLRVALQLLTATPYRMSETEFLSTLTAVRQARDPVTLFVADFTGEAREPGSLDERELRNAWLPLLRLLQARAASLRDSVVPPAREPVLGPALSEEELQALRSDARTAEAEDRWLDALELWTAIARGAQGEGRSRARLARAKTLFELGEFYLGEVWLRGLLLFGEDTEIRELAYSQLMEELGEQNDHEAMLMVAAAALEFRDQVPQLETLVPLLVETGEFRAALMLGLLVPAEAWDRKAMAIAAGRVGWMEVLEQVLEGMPEEQRDLQLGIQAAMEGKDAEALDHFDQAGEEGEKLAGFLLRGRQIALWLRSPDEAVRGSALPAWTAWQRDHPGGRTWRREPGCLRRASGMEVLTSVALNRSHSVFRIDAGTRAEGALVGPVQVRLEVRPLHSSTTGAPVDGWITLSSGEAVRYLPVTGNVPVAGLRLSRQAAGVPGRCEVYELEFGPGLHEFTIAGGELSLLARILVSRPLRPFAVLPALTPDLLCAVFAGTTAPRSDVGAASERELLVLTEGAQPELACVALDEPMAAAAFARNSSSEEFRAWLELVRPWREPGAPAPLPWSFDEAFLSPGRVPDSAQQVLDRAPDAEPVEQLKRLVLAAERRPELYESFLVAGEELFHRSEKSPELVRLWKRLTRFTEWTCLSTVEQSAGIRQLEMEGWSPEAPFLRVRKALLEPFSPEELVLSGSDRLQTILVLPVPTTYFGRLMSLEDAEGYAAGKVDRDLFTSYKREHRFGATLSETLVYRPWLDTELFGQAGVTGNENFSADHVRFRAGLRQCLGALQLEAVFGYRYYFRDHDRKTSSDPMTVTLGLEGELWRDNLERLELGVRHLYDIDTKDHTLYFTFDWHFGNGRGYRDFRPGEVRFRKIRTRRIPDTRNNEFRVGD